jgi:hypothetical protein
VQQKVSDQGASQEWAEESSKANNQRFAPFAAEDRGFQFGSSEEGKNDRPCAS